MASDRARLEAIYQELADDELLRRCASGELTEFAHSIAAAEVRSRGLELPLKREEPKDEVYLGDWVIVARYLSYAEVHLMRSMLEGAGIPAEVADAHLVQTDALLIPAMRGSSLRVPVACVNEAQELIAALKRGDLQLPEDFEPKP